MQHLALDIDNEERPEEDLSATAERLAVASQSAGLAELSASVAHEVNQPLAAVVANAHACLRWLSADPPNIERAKIAAQRIVRDANGASEVVGQFRTRFRLPTAGGRVTTAGTPD